jgi:glycosyltransferase involved in cell wall biosynthesis
MNKLATMLTTTSPMTTPTKGNKGKPKVGMILYMNPDYYPPTVNAAHLLSEHFDVVLIGRNYDFPDGEYPSNVSVHRLGRYSSIQERMNASPWAKFWEYLNFIFQARYLLKEVSLIYAYDAYGYTAAYLCQRLLPKKIPILYQNHEIETKLSGLSSLAGWVQRAERAWISRAKLVIFPDKDRANFFQKITGIKKVPIIVPNFPRKSVFTLSDDWISIIQKRWNSITLFCRGSISETSAMREIIFAASLLKRFNRNIRVEFVGFLGEAEGRSLTNWVEQSEMSNSFSYLGVLPYKDLQTPTVSATVGFALYKNIAFDRVACASACNKIYEYAACGLPVIVSDFSTYRDYLGNESWVRFADPEDPTAIVSAVQDILSDFKQYREMCLAARKAFEQKFNYELVFSPLISKMQELVDIQK